MIILESRFRHGDNLDYQLIVYINFRGSFNSHAKHPKLLDQGFKISTCNATADYFRSKWGSFYSFLALAVPSDESTVNVNEDPRVWYPSQMITSVIRVEKTCDLDWRAQRICHVRRQLILIIWIVLLPVLAFAEVSTVAWHTWIKFFWICHSALGRKTHGGIS